MKDYIDNVPLKTSALDLGANFVEFRSNGSGFRIGIFGVGSTDLRAAAWAALSNSAVRRACRCSAS